MGTASFAQTSFLGGEFSPQMQGRFDLPEYRTGLNVCLNIVPIEEGSAPRRSGTRLGGVTRSGAYGVLREYSVSQEQPYDIELTEGHLRLWQAGGQLVTHPGTAVSAISAASSAVFTSTTHGLAVGDQVIFTLSAATSYAGISQVLGRQLSVTVAGTNTFVVEDALTGEEINGALIDFSALTGLIVYKIYDLPTDYGEADLQQVRVVQDGVDALLLHPDYPTQTLTINTNSLGVFTSATLVATTFYDGPYLDIPTDGTTLTPSATSGSITFTASAITSINSGQGFLAADVGRMFRVFSEPAAWASGTAYVTGNQVKEADVYWKAVQASTGKQPSTDAGIYWVIDTTAAAWTWGTISSITSATVFVGALHAAVTYPDNTAGGNLLYVLPITAWQLGAYSGSTGYPAVGAYYQGRIWLGGAIKNRFDACVSNDFSVNGHINFAPTGKDGTVADNNGIAGTLNAKEIENFLWMLPDEQGILAGTQGGEWVIASSASGEPITATSILTREMTHYGSFNTPAIKVGRAAIFVHRDTRKVYEYMSNYFTQKFVADNLSLKAKHLTSGGIAEVAYMRELTPVIWARLSDGGFIGCTYKHDDPIKPLEFAAWHQHELGTGRDVISIQSGPANGGQTDTLSMVTQDPTTRFCYVEFLQTLWDDGDDLLTAWYVDGGINIAAAELVAADTVRLYGLWYMAGEEVTVWGAGLDLGDFTVSATGTIDLTLNQATSLFTLTFLAEVTARGCTSLSTEIIGSALTAPTVYIMEAKENYDAAHISTIEALTTYTGSSMNTDQNYQGIQWDPVRRNLMYMYTEDIPTTPTTNTTTHTLWDGFATIAANAAVDPSHQFNTSIGVKNIDTEVVTFYPNYKLANVVPNGIGGSDGTFRRYTEDFKATSDGNNGNGPGMTDPYTGNFWINSQSCPLYCFRRSDDYSLVISPLFPVIDPDSVVRIVGFNNVGSPNAWAFAREVDMITSPNHAYLYLIPRELTAAEIAADYLLRYATFTYPVVWSVALNPNLYPAYNREIFDSSGKMYLFSCTAVGGKSFKLYKFTLPTSAPYGGPTVGGGFTDITPWGASTGPNADASGYTLARTADYDSTTTIETADIIPLYLRGTDDLVLIEKFFPAEHTASSSDPALMFWSCTYVHSPSSAPTWDHHSAFVTGYMTAAWAPTNISGAAYSVTDAFEVNSYLGQSDYNYSDSFLDYTKRWFFFVCTKVSNGVSDGVPRIVLVEYQFTYGSAPSVSQIIDEQGWDDEYPDFRRSSNFYPPFDAVDAGLAAAMMTTFNTDLSRSLWDVGIHDAATNTFWWSGGATDLNGSTALFGTFDPQFANRMQRADHTPGGSTIAATPPFLKLSFALTYCAPFFVGHTYCSRGQILRPVTPQESMTQTGPSLGKLRRTTYAAPLLADTQGMSMGVDFLDMRPLDFKTNNGVGQAGGGVTTLPLSETFSGVYWGLVDSASNYDNMWCWEVCRPYPCTVVAVELQHKANENV